MKLEWICARGPEAHVVAVLVRRSTRLTWESPFMKGCCVENGRWNSPRNFETGWSGRPCPHPSSIVDDDVCNKFTHLFLPRIDEVVHTTDSFILSSLLNVLTDDTRVGEDLRFDRDAAGLAH